MSAIRIRALDHVVLRVSDVARSLRFPAPYKGKSVTLNHPLMLAPPHGSHRRGTLTRSQIAGAFGRARHDFKACYDRSAKKKPKLSGSLVVEMTVSAAGEASLVRIGTDELKDKELSLCVLERARQLRFPAPKHAGSVEIAYPLKFAPAAQK